MSGDGERVSAAFVRIAELADARGAVPEDGSGIDGTWTTSVADPDTGDDWYVGVNADVEDDRRIEFPEPHGEVTVPAAHAAVFYGDVFGPVAFLSPRGGRFVVDGRDPELPTEGSFPRSTEDQLIAALEAALDEYEDSAADEDERDLDVPGQVLEALPDHVVETYSEKMLVLEYEEKYLDVRFPVLECRSCGAAVDHRVEIDSYRETASTECSECGAVDEAVVDGDVLDLRGADRDDRVDELAVGLSIDVDEDALEDEDSTDA